MKLLLIDAYALIYRSYYAFIKNPRISSKGMNTSAVFGFVNTLEDVIKRLTPTHIAVGFDPPGSTFRHEIYKQYKEQRQETPEVIRQSVPVIREIIEAYNIPILEAPRYEADDVIGTVAGQAEKEGFEVFMMTPDKDYAQLVSEHIFQYRPKFAGDYETLGVNETLEKYALTSVAQITDLLGLMGDKSDNIPGCPGIGEITAQKLLKEFGSIENLTENVSQLKGSLRKKIEENTEQIKFSKFLATIVTDVPIKFNAEKSLRQPANEKKLTEIYTELEFRSFLSKMQTGKERFSSFSAQKKTETKDTAPRQLSLFDEIIPAGNNTQPPTAATGNPSLKDIATTPHIYHLVDTREKMKELGNFLQTQQFFAFDTETDEINPLTAKLVGISFAVKEYEAWYVPLPQDMETAKTILFCFSNALRDKSIVKIGQNIKYDILVLRKYDIKIKGNLFDTMIAHYLMHPELRHGMDYLSETYLKYKPVPIEALIGEKGKNQASMRNVPVAKVAEYAAEDADVTLRLKNYFEPQLNDLSLKYLFNDIEMLLIHVLADMEHTGVKLDTQALEHYSVVLSEKLDALIKEIYEFAGTEFNINSTKQVGEILFEKLKITDEKVKKTKTGGFSTSEDTLEKLRNRHPVIAKLLDYRGLKKLLSTYVDALPKLADERTGKIHTSFNQTVTSTGRLSSTNPNLQNIPVRNEQGKEIRKAFIPENNNCMFFSADYSQIELRIMAHLSNDEAMIEAFRKGADIHAATAARIYGLSDEDVTPEMRRKAKTANFGIIYGISMFGLADRLNISRSEAKALIEGYFKTYPRIRAYMDESIAKARTNGYVETIFKRKSHLPDIYSNNAVVRGYAERFAINAPVQGSAAEIIKIAMIRIYADFEHEQLKSKMILQVHDELNFNVYNDEIDKVRKIVIHNMENAVRLNVPLIAECGTGRNWFEAH
ncbi:MAG: DNA polymerase I [Tannerella sp.]|jgi:DNA polymerase-1|nr:DNA polymerase I [Tannerella sp.]